MTRIALLVALAACNAANADSGQRLVDPAPAPIAVAIPTAPGGLVIDEVGAGGMPDWFEVVNATTAPIDLSGFVYVDVADDLDRARPFPAFTLRPGERHVQNVDKLIDGFRLGAGEELWIYRMPDGELVDGVDWDHGDSAPDGSFARVPSITGAFVPVARDTRGAPNA